MYVAHVHHTHQRETERLCLGKHTSLLANTWSCTVSRTDQISLSLFIFCQESLSVWECLLKWPHLSLHHSNRRLVHGHFVIPFALSMRHRRTVAGDSERLFVFWVLFFFVVLYVFFSNKTVTWSVPENQHWVLSGIQREKHCYYTITCISFWGTKGLFMTHSNAGWLG